jgi:hypothetical protein
MVKKSAQFIVLKSGACSHNLTFLVKNQDKFDPSVNFEINLSKPLGFRQL